MNLNNTSILCLFSNVSPLIASTGEHVIMDREKSVEHLHKLLQGLFHCAHMHIDCIKQVQSAQMLTNILQRITKQNTGA
ncbi:hypothetical protein PROFUN_10131 [Planoprotostelium fungivorum]|uniref:Uncharacterized protein n=1 Tax=Planoprotostelium fungivorum TaxID=1890364 RepID=A0A2P6NES0_9EUKA|nr:hypothetical protein PROFUN_10131 [Planoprotostelium fungivorum]